LRDECQPGNRCADLKSENHRNIGIPLTLPRRIGIDEIDVWAVDIGPDSPVWGTPQILGESERRRAAAFQSTEDRHRYAATHGALRLIAGGLTGTSPADVRFGVGAFGKPRLTTGCGRCALQFSLTRSRDLAILAFTMIGPIGVDMEWIDEHWDPREIHRQLVPGLGLEGSQKGCFADRRQLFYERWVCFEARAKAEGRGLFAPEEQEGERRFSTYSFAPRPGYVACVAVEHPGAVVRIHPWPPSAAVREADRRAGELCGLPRRLRQLARHSPPQWNAKL
jgi:4'-phosphopantetheinyl transferase